MKPIRTLLAEDHTIVREGLRTLLRADKGIEVVAEARNGREAVRLSRALRPDVVVLDIAMPRLNGLEAARQIMARAPKTRVLILSAYSDDAYIDGVIAAGAVGFLVKQTSAQILEDAIHAVMEGRMFYSPQVAKHVRSHYKRSEKPTKLTKRKGTTLTSRELEVIRRIAEGETNKQVASGLNISIKTVEKHRQHLMEKLSIHDTAGLTRYAVAHGIVDCNVKITNA
jgi:DNA-binding NarL/FixJ family response regulator